MKQSVQKVLIFGSSLSNKLNTFSVGASDEFILV